MVFQAAKSEPGQELKDLWDPKSCSGSGQCPVTDSAGIQSSQTLLGNCSAPVQSTLGDVENMEVISHDSCPKGTCDPVEEARWAIRTVLTHVPSLGISYWAVKCP